ncbi:MAG: hypothetical protein KAT90_12430 [Gammaproteobacteria bacterium]|nr:hypothetical protein [Gammaproteobacteria bacterium]
MDITKKAAEILIEAGAIEAQRGDIGFFIKCSPSHKRLIKWVETEKIERFIEAFADTLEGRRQADAIEDWLCNNKSDLWSAISKPDSELYEMKGYITSAHQWRLDRIKWCLEQLTEAEK